MKRWNRDRMGPHPPPPRNGSSLTGLDEVTAAGWLSDPDSHQLFVQTFYQQDGYAVTLLLAERDDGGNGEAWDPPHFRR
jgi:hypothetical protein